MPSAPRSARFWPAQGPASTRDRSRTRMCDSGPAMQAAFGRWRGLQFNPGSSPAFLQQVFGELGKTRSRGGARNVLRFIREQILETPHVGHADRMAEAGEQRRVVRRVAREYDFSPGLGEIHSKAFAEKHPAHRQLVVLAEPAVDVNRADLRVEARRAHQRSEEHTSELQSHSDLVCRLLL